MAEGHIRERTLPSGTKRYDAMYRDPEGKPKSSTCKTKKEAQRFLREKLREIDRGEYRELKEIRFSAFCKLWLDDYVEGRLKDTTRKDYEIIISRHLLPHFGNVKLTSISAEACQKLIAKKLKAGLSPKTVINILVPLKEMLKHAVMWGYLLSNPADYVEKPRTRKRHPEILSLKQIKDFLSHIKEPYRTVVITAALTGLRRGEVLALKDKDIDFAKSVICLRRSFSRGKLTTTKSEDSDRNIPLSNALASFLLAHLARRTESPAGWLFVNERGNPINGDNMYRRHYRPALEKAGIGKSINLHSLRHTLATMLLEQGENVKVVQDILGHSSATITLDVYSHAIPSSSKAALDRFADDFLAALSDQGK